MKIAALTVIFVLQGVLFACNPGREGGCQDEIAGLKEQVRILTSMQEQPGLADGKMKHTVMFCLKSDPDSPEATRFLEDGKRILSAIPVVENFEVYRQVSPKNEYCFYFSMVFADSSAYKAYNEHPDHVRFVSERWDTEVSKFLEADFKN